MQLILYHADIAATKFSDVIGQIVLIMITKMYKTIFFNKQTLLQLTLTIKTKQIYLTKGSIL